MYWWETAKPLSLKDGQQIKLCDKYNYLGMKTTHDGRLGKAIRERNIQKKKLNSTSWNQNIFTTNKHKKLYKSIVTYGSEI